jgi:hypothetical protein
MEYSIGSRVWYSVRRAALWSFIYQIVFTSAVHVMNAIEVQSMTAVLDPVMLLASFVYIRIWFPIILLVVLPVMMVDLVGRNAIPVKLVLLALSLASCWWVVLNLASWSMRGVFSTLVGLILFGVSVIHILRSRPVGTNQKSTSS